MYLKNCAASTESPLIQNDVFDIQIRQVTSPILKKRQTSLSHSHVPT